MDAGKNCRRFAVFSTINPEIVVISYSSCLISYKVEQFRRFLAVHAFMVDFMWLKVFTAHGQQTSAIWATNHYGDRPDNSAYLDSNPTPINPDVRVLRSPRPILSALLHGTQAVGVSETMRRRTRNGITELTQRAPPIFGWAAITLGIGPHSSLCHV